MKIGGQVWLVENYKCEHKNNGIVIPNIEVGDPDWYDLRDSKEGACCYYDNDEDNKDEYGVLYNWFAVDNENFAIDGWHVPSDAEWTALEDYLVGAGFNWDGTTSGNKIGKSMAGNTEDWAMSGTPGDVGNSVATNNRSDFTGLPGGYRSTASWACPFYDIGEAGYWWSSTERPAVNSGDAYRRSLNTNYSELRYGGTGSMRSMSKSYGYSVRLVKY